MAYNLRWSEESVKNLEEIIEDLRKKWTEKEVSAFKDKLSTHLDLIIKYPFMFPSSTSQPRLRKAVLSKQTSIFYEIKGGTIFLAYLHLNKKDLGRIK